MKHSSETSHSSMAGWQAWLRSLLMLSQRVTWDTVDVAAAMFRTGFFRNLIKLRGSIRVPDRSAGEHLYEEHREVPEELPEGPITETTSP